jgi:hypothetical protein
MILPVRGIEPFTRLFNADILILSLFIDFLHKALFILLFSQINNKCLSSSRYLMGL